MIADFLFDDLFPLLVALPDRVLSIVTSSFRDLFDALMANWQLNISLPSWSFFDRSLLAVMLGSAVSYFISIVLIRFIKNLI